MAVYYRYRSEVKTFSVPVPGPTVSVGELKRLIMGSARYGHHRDAQSIEFYKSPTCEEQYGDDAKPVPLYSTVIACRLPDSPAETITVVAASSPLTPKSAQRHGSSSSSATSSTSPAARSPAGPVLAPLPSIPADLHCKICSNVMADAVVTSECCFWSYCDRCVRDQIAETSRCVCGVPAHSNELIPNPAVSKTITNQLAELDATENVRSSNGSNATPPRDASQKKPGTVSKHRDGSSSSPTSKSTMTIENHEPHRAILHPRQERKKTDRQDRRQPERSFKRRCGSPRPEAPGA